MLWAARVEQWVNLRVRFKRSKAEESAIITLAHEPTLPVIKYKTKWGDRVDAHQCGCRAGLDKLRPGRNSSPGSRPSPPKALWLGVVLYVEVLAEAEDIAGVIFHVEISATIIRVANLARNLHALRAQFVI